MSNKGSPWDNPFGGMFDINRDGKESLAEQWLAYQVSKECTKESSPNDEAPRSSALNFDFDDDDSDDSSWRDYCDDNDYGIDPEDYDTEEEYEKAIEEAENGW